MPKINRLYLFNTFGIILICIFILAIYKESTLPNSRYYERNMKLEADNLNSNFSGKEISDGIKFKNAVSIGKSFEINLEILNKIVTKRDLIQIMQPKFCSFMLNSGDFDINQSDFHIIGSNQNNYANVEIIINRDSCISAGYRPTTG